MKRRLDRLMCACTSELERTPSEIDGFLGVSSRASRLNQEMEFPSNMENNNLRVSSKMARALQS